MQISTVRFEPGHPVNASSMANSSPLENDQDVSISSTDIEQGSGGSGSAYIHERSDDDKEKAC
jgi:hypothetical protein